WPGRTRGRDRPAQTADQPHRAGRDVARLGPFRHTTGSYLPRSRRRLGVPHPALCTAPRCCAWVSCLGVEVDASIFVKSFSLGVSKPTTALAMIALMPRRRRGQALYGRSLTDHPVGASRRRAAATVDPCAEH